MLINPYRFAASTLLLDFYPEAAAAYSLRQLRTGVTNVVRVRRSSDNTEANFTAAEVTNGTLAAWVGAGSNGFVRTWYDQSGNSRDVIQATLSAQPQLVSNGSVLLQNGRPSISFDTSDVLLSASVSRTDNSIFAVFSVESLDTDFAIPFGSDDSGAGLGVRPTLKLYDAMSTFNANAANNTVALGKFMLASSINHLSDSKLYKNANLVSQQTGTIVARSKLAIGKELSSGFTAASCRVQEFILYTTNQTTTRASIEANINSHFAIY